MVAACPISTFLSSPWCRAASRPSIPTRAYGDVTIERTLSTTGSGTINLPNNLSAAFKVEGVAVGPAVTAENLNEFLGVRKHTYGRAEEENQVGQVVGLAMVGVGQVEPAVTQQHAFSACHQGAQRRCRDQGKCHGHSRGVDADCPSRPQGFEADTTAGCIEISPQVAPGPAENPARAAGWGCAGDPMQCSPLSLVQQRLQVGAPLPFNIRDHDQTLLLARGQRVQDNAQLRALLDPSVRRVAIASLGSIFSMR